MLAWLERFEVDIEGRDGSKTPADPECFRECPPGLLELRLRGEALRCDSWSWLPATDLAAAAAEERGEGVGREKFCRLVALELEWAVEKPGAGGCGENCGSCCCVGLRTLDRCRDMESSLEEDSTRRTRGRGGGGRSAAAAAAAAE